MTEMAPVVSVLIPLYNAEPYLAEALESVFGQTYSDFEVIAVNDGSTDKTREVLTAFAGRERRLRIVDQPNQGIVEALNTGLALCRGRYVARMDGDDISHPERFELQVRHLEENPGCVCVGTLKHDIDSQGKRFRSDRIQRGPTRQTDLERFPPYVATLPHPGIMVRRCAFTAIGNYRHGFPHAEDYDLFLRLAPLGRIDTMDRILLDYRVHASSLSERHLHQQIESAITAILAAIDDAIHSSTDMREVRSQDYYMERIADPLVPGAVTILRRMFWADGLKQRGRVAEAKRISIGAAASALVFGLRHPGSPLAREVSYRSARAAMRIIFR